MAEHRNISAWAIRNPVATIVLFLLLTVAGLVAYPLLRINNTPDLDLPVVVVTVAQPGAAPTELETQVTRRVEDAVAGLGDVRHITSTVLDGASTTVIEFVLGKNIDRATNDVRDRVARIRADLPAAIRDPVISRVEATGGAILTYTVAAPAMTQEQLSWFVEDTVAKALLSVRGVAEINRVGGVEREIRVALRPDRMLALGITAAQVNDQLRVLNIDLPGGRGTLGSAEQAIRTLGSAETVETLRARSIVLPNGRTARLSDLADVSDATAEVRTAARLDGRPVVAFEVMRTKGSSKGWLRACSG
jgi:multidrug efflux pump subunit AcrB